MSTFSVKRFLNGGNFRHLCKANVSSSAGNILCDPRTIEIPNVSLPEFVFHRIEPYLDLVAFECGITSKKFTFGQARKYSKNLSKILRTKLKLNPKQVALTYTTNCPEFPVAVLGCLEAGLTVSIANSLYTPDEIARQLKDSAASIIITNHELYDNAVKACAKLGQKLPIICIRTTAGQLLPQGAIDFQEIINAHLDIQDLPLPDAEDVAFLPYSSGTTGLPKGVVLTHKNVVANTLQYTLPNCDNIQPALGTFQETVPGVLPMFHIFGLTCNNLGIMVNGGKLVTLPKFQPKTFVEVLKNYPISLLFTAPPLILFMSQYADLKPEFLKHLRVILSGAAPLSASDEARFMQKAQRDIFISQGYGLTETSPVVTASTKASRDKFGAATYGTTGKVVVNTQVKFVKPGDPRGEALGPNEQGEIFIKGPQVMKGYLNRPEATAATFSDGWFMTGDLGHYDENGLVFITDRVKELIKVRGYQVAPAELEELLRDFPGVEDVAVIGIPDRQSGEVPRAYIKAKGHLNLTDINKFVAEKAAKYKQLEGGIELVGEVPRSAAGKILRKELRKKYLEQIEM